jgi:hypothetical protein
MEMRPTTLTIFQLFSKTNERKDDAMMTKSPNKGSKNQNAPTQDAMSLLNGPASGDNSKGRKQNKSQNDKTDLYE